MTEIQKIIKYAALVLAALLIISIVGGIVGVASKVFVISSLIDRDETAQTLRDLTVDAAVDTLQLELRSVSLVIEAGEAFTAKTDDPDVTCEVNGDTLRIQEKNGGWFEQEGGGELVITLPATQAFKKVDIDAGAGKVDIAALTADHFSLDIGAGDVHIGTLHATDDAAVNGGAGKITIDNGSVADFDLDMGVGQFTAAVALSGDCDIDCGVGQMQLTLLGAPDDYCIKLDKGIGLATVDGNALADGATYGDGSTIIDIDGGVGAVKVEFKEIS